MTLNKMAKCNKQTLRYLLQLRSLVRNVEKSSCRLFSQSSENKKTIDKDAELEALHAQKLAEFLKENPIPDLVRNTEKEYFDSWKDPKRKRGISESIVTLVQPWISKDYIIDDDSEKLFQHNTKTRKLLREDQRYRRERVEALGYELAAAHFIVHRYGAVKFVGHDAWFLKKESEANPLPKVFIKNVYLEGIDLSNTLMTSIATENFAHLSHLRYMRLHNCPVLDDWFLAQLYHLKDTLEFLDISNCPEITDNGLSCLHHLSRLKCLRLTNLENVKHIGLISLLLEDKIPGLMVLGINEEQLMPQTTQPVGERKLVCAFLGYLNGNGDFSKGSTREKYKNDPYLKEMFGIVREVD
ncbi:hypothetical protein Btru_025589 [Bulinus truncatus]|nr:hypothetical protein Btru_025589 [Bulinus truncatus]